jgi:hypothetical protein
LVPINNNQILKIRPGFDSVKLVSINNNQISKIRPGFDLVFFSIGIFTIFINNLNGYWDCYHGSNMSASSPLAWLQQPWQIREKIKNPKKK